MSVTTVTVPKHYAFVLNNVDDTPPTITVKRLETGDFEVSGEFDDLLSFIEGVCLDDEESIDDIMDTAR
jgi:hypothetical protein